MTMNAMDDYIRARGFEVKREYLPGPRKYRFTLIKDGYYNDYFWAYPHGNANTDHQRDAMDDMIEDMNACITLLKTSNAPYKPYHKYARSNYKLEIKKVHFNDPMTIVIWSDGTKTIVKAHNEPFDREKGLAMAITKKFLGNKYNYAKEFKKWLE